VDDKPSGKTDNYTILPALTALWDCPNRKRREAPKNRLKLLELVTGPSALFHSSTNTPTKDRGFGISKIRLCRHLLPDIQVTHPIDKWLVAWKLPSGSLAAGRR